MTAAKQVIQKRKDQLDEIAEDEYKKFTDEAVRRLYKAKPKKVWVNDVALDDQGKFIRDLLKKLILPC